MKNISFLLLLLALSGPAWGQASYTGTIGPAAIELTLNDDLANGATGVYLYRRYGVPIALSGTLKGGVLTLTEKDAHGKPAATFRVPGYNPAAPTCAGTWRNLATGQQLPLALAAQPGPAQDLLQAASLPKTYFKVTLPTAEARSLSKVQVLEKGTNRLVQEIALAGCRPMGTNSVSVADYNFDGQPDFAVFEASYAGPNTSSQYFLYDPASRRFVKSSFSGVSLEFDPQKKRVTERNSSGAGTSVTTAEYQVVRNQLVLVAHHCYQYDEKLKKLVEHKWSACN